uniref:Uncharacterized protein n=1 Tax=Romanomermis culicivorax TaxID=13658 RepID=A0A915IQD0_ROMCU
MNVQAATPQNGRLPVYTLPDFNNHSHRIPRKHIIDSAIFILHLMVKILSVGLLCVDVVSYVDQYPEEDSAVHCRDQLWTTGGNATNVCKGKLGIYKMQFKNSLRLFLEKRDLTILRNRDF